MTDNQPTAPRPKKPKFKYTRELVRIAIHDGMTQKEIADLCRVEQSVVGRTASRSRSITRWSS